MAHKLQPGTQIIRNAIRRHKCQPCAEQQKKIMAVSWCTECQVALCTNCHKHHDALKLTRYHHVISMRLFQSKLTAGHIAQKLDKMQIKAHQNKKDDKTESNIQYEDKSMVADKIKEPILSPEDIEVKERMNAVKFTYDSSIDLLKGENGSVIRDIKVLSNGDIIMIDGNNNRILISELGGIKQKEFSLPGKPSCLAIAPDDTVAVSLYEKGKVVMVDIFNRQIFREIVMKCFGLVFTDAYLILNCGGTGIKATDIYGDVYETFPEVRGDGYLFIGHDGHVYCNSCQSNKILCCNLRRNLTTTFSTMSIEHPLGTTIDDEGFIYEVGIQSPKVNIISHEGSKASESVHMISPDGRQQRLVLTKQDGVSNPYAVYFDMDRKLLFVANNYGESVLVFKKKPQELTETDFQF